MIVHDTWNKVFCEHGKGRDDSLEQNHGRACDVAIAAAQTTST